MAAIAAAGALGAWAADRRRSRRRNESGRCAACGTAWTSSTVHDAYLIHGRLVCEDCGRTARKRLPWQFGAVALFSLVAIGSATAAQGPTAIALFCAVGTAGMLVGATTLMKLANRRAQRRIAAGDYPGVDALRASDEVTRDPDRVIDRTG